MATLSFTQNVVIKNSEKKKEIVKALENSNSSFAHVKPSNEVDRTKEVAKIWFKR